MILILKKMKKNCLTSVFIFKILNWFTSSARTLSGLWKKFGKANEFHLSSSLLIASSMLPTYCKLVRLIDKLDMIDDRGQSSANADAGSTFTS